MAVEEREHRELQEALMGAIGPDHTDTLMSYLPPVGWADVATKRDLDGFAHQLRAEMADLRGELRAEMGTLRGEMGTLRGEMGTLRGEMGALQASLHRELRIHFYALTGLILALAGTVITLHVSGG